MTKSILAASLSIVGLALFVSHTLSSVEPIQREEDQYFDASVVVFDETHVICDGRAWRLDGFVETNSNSPICLLINQSSNDSRALGSAWCSSDVRADGRSGVRVFANLNHFPSPPDGESFEMRFVLFQNGAKFYRDPEI